MKNPRYTVRKLDFNKGYVVYDTAAKRDLNGTLSTYRSTALAQATRMNARCR